MILLPLLCFGIMCACLDFFTGYTWRSDFPFRWKGNYHQLFHAGRKEQPYRDMDWSAHGIIWNNYTQFQRKKMQVADNNDYITKNCYINLYELNIVKRNDLTAIMVCPSTLGWLVVLNPKSTATVKSSFRGMSVRPTSNLIVSSLPDVISAHWTLKFMWVHSTQNDPGSGRKHVNFDR